MGQSCGRRQNRVSSRAIGDALTQAEVIRCRVAGASWAEIADEFGYRSRSGAEHAFRSGLEGSWLIPALRVVMHGRTERLEGRLRVLESQVAPDVRDEHCQTLDHVGHMKLLLHDVPGARPWQACVADVAGLIAKRNPHFPTVDVAARDQRLLARQRGATLDEMCAGYANRSGLQKALERDVRRLLLVAAAEYFEDELLGIRFSWAEIDLAVRCRPVNVPLLGARLDGLDELLDSMHVFDVLLTYGHLARSHQPTVRRP